MEIAVHPTTRRVLFPPTDKLLPTALPSFEFQHFPIVRRYVTVLLSLGIVVLFAVGCKTWSYYLTPVSPKHLIATPRAHPERRRH